MSGERFQGTSGRTLKLEYLRQAMADDRVPVIAKLGLVFKPDNEPHFIFDEDTGVWVDVKLVPSGELLLCRLAAAGGGAGRGLWRVPKPGTEVVVLVPGGEFEGGGVIVSGLSTGAKPDQVVDEDILVLLNDKIVHIESSTDKVEVKGKGDVKVNSVDGSVVLQDGTKNVARINAGDKVESHDHTVIFTLTADLSSVGGTTGVVNGSITVQTRAGLELVTGGNPNVKA